VRRRPAIPVPTLVRTGTEDQNAPPAWAQAITAAIPGARLESVPGVGHALLSRDAEGTPDAVEGFLRGR